MGKQDWIWQYDALDIYKMVLSGRIKKFPLNYWSSPYNLQYAEICLRHLFEERLQWTDEEILKKLSQATFVKHKLGGLLDIIFDSSPQRAFHFIYPDKFKPWEFRQVPSGFWNETTAIESIKWLLEEKLKWDDEQIKKKYNINVLEQYGIGSMVRKLYGGSPYTILDLAYPDRFKPWEFSQAGVGYWNKDTATQSIKWLFEEKLKWNDNQIKENLSQETFISNGLNGMMQQVFKGSPYDAFNYAYPNRFKPWEFKYVPTNYWNDSTCREAIIHTLEVKLNWSFDDIRENYQASTLINHGLGGMLTSYFGCSSWEAINTAYPNMFYPWEFKQVPKHFWNDETCNQAIKWLIEKKLKWTEDDIKEKLTCNTFKEYGLSGMLSIYFDYSPHQAINHAYPNKFPKATLKGYNNEK